MRQGKDRKMWGHRRSLSCIATIPKGKGESLPIQNTNARKRGFTAVVEWPLAQLQSQDLKCVEPSNTLSHPFAERDTTRIRRQSLSAQRRICVSTWRGERNETAKKITSSVVIRQKLTIGRDGIKAKSSLSLQVYMQITYIYN